MDLDPLSILIITIDVQGSLLIQVVLLVLLLVTSGLVSGAEVAFFSLTKEILDSEEEKKSRQMEIIKKQYLRISVNPIGRFGFIRSLFLLLFRPCQFYLK